MTKREIKKHRFKMPDTAAFFIVLIIFTAFLTLIIPSGSFDRVIDEETGRTLVVGGTYHATDIPSITVFQILSSIYRGIIKNADIVAFIFIAGGSFGILNSTGAFASGVDTLIRRFDGREELLISVIMIVLAICGGTFGMAEEVLPFIAVLVAACEKMNLGRHTGVAIVIVGIYSGYTAGPLNPFNTGLGQGIAELPVFSGIGLRLVLMAATMITGIHHVVSQAKKYKAATIATSHLKISNTVNTSCEPLNTRHKIVLLIMLVSILIMVFGIIMYGWYFEEIIAVFTAMGFVAGIFYFRNLDDVGKSFVNGACEMSTAVMYFAFVTAVMVIMEDGQIMDTIVHALSIPLSQVSGVLAAWGIFFFQSIINIFIPSSSGQAAAVMPILVPLADIIGVSRQTTVLAYQCGGGFMNMITPTQMVVTAACALGGIKFSDWAKYAWPLVVKWVIIGLIAVALAVVIDYGPF